MKVDLNSDLGESFGRYKLGLDEEVMKYITSANVACGWHAGDPLVMRKTVKLAKENGIKSISFPSISTGAFGYPVKEASLIALETVIDYLKKYNEIELVRFVLFSERDFSAYKESLEKLETKGKI